MRRRKKGGGRRQKREKNKSRNGTLVIYALNSNFFIVMWEKLLIFKIHLVFRVKSERKDVIP